MTDGKNAGGWTEDDSRHFIDHGAYFVPERETQTDTICSVIPPAPDGAAIVDICCGEGLLCEALARRFPRAEIHALDGNERMLDFFRDDGWNYYADPEADPVDMPSTLFDQMLWMADAGMTAIDVHWLRAGHAIFSGMKP